MKDKNDSPKPISDKQRGVKAFVGGCGNCQCDQGKFKRSVKEVPHEKR